MLLIVEEATLAEEPGAQPALLDGYGAVSNATARMLVCGGEVTPVLIRFDGKPLDVGRADGNPTLAQRNALAARDGGCVGCGAPVARCQVHHIVWRSKGGATVIDNLCLLCWDCHHRVHHQGWEVVRTPEGKYNLVSPLMGALRRAG